MYKIAKMYYSEELNQSEIAKRVGLSRPQISRYLKRARETGMVEITIYEPLELTKKEIELKLKNLLSLKKVFVGAINPAFDSDKHAIDVISSVASNYLPELIMESNEIGIGWGRTVYSTILSMSFFDNKKKISFVPLIGGIGQKEPCYQINSLIDRIGEKFEGKRIFLNTPAFINHNESYNNTINSENFKTVVKNWKNLDLAIIGLGGPINCSKILQSEINPEIVEKLKKMNATGDINGQFFNSEGKICKTGMEKNIIGLDINELKKIKNVVCLSGGKEKANGIIAGARGKFFNTLITDFNTAKEIISILEDNS